MIYNPDWHKPKVKPYFHQISLECIEKLVDCQVKSNKDEMDYDTGVKTMKQILKDEFEDPEFLAFAIENHSELFGYIASGRVNISINRLFPFSEYKPQLAVTMPALHSTLLSFKQCEIDVF